MEQTLPVNHNKARAPLALLGALLMTLLVFLAIPITQHLGNQRNDLIEFRQAMTITPPAPLILPPPPEKVEQPEPQPTPEFKQQLQDFSLSQLELSLNPGISGALRVAVTSTGFATEVDALSEIQKLFTFADLQSAPRIINSPSIVYPRELVRRGIREGRVDDTWAVNNTRGTLQISKGEKLLDLAESIDLSRKACARDADSQCATDAWV